MKRAVSRRAFAAVVLCIAVTSLSPVATAGEERARFIVVLDDSSDAQAVAADHSRRFGAEISFVYEHALKGYAASVPGSAISEIQGDGRVRFVERDEFVHAVASTQSGATWGLDRVDQPSLPLNSTFNYSNTGTGVKAYIIDTGIRFSHSDFAGRAVSGTDKVDGGTADDCDGHGTHVAGTVGGTTYGVAKSVSLVAVRVLDCSGSGYISWIVAGVDWVTADHQAGQPAVANMSLGASGSSSIDTAVNNSIKDGVSYAVAAGNGNLVGIHQDACKYSPARVAAAMTIGATDKSDYKASFSNYGSCVDWFAPGVSITSAYNTSDTATTTISGTSMASPHTAGVAALYLQSNPSATPAQVRDAVYNLTTKGIVKSSRTANNHLLFTNL